jgi:hypothetical protein
MCVFLTLEVIDLTSDFRNRLADLPLWQGYNMLARLLPPTPHILAFLSVKDLW